MKELKTDQWKRIETADINLHKYSQLILNKGAKAVFSTNGAGVIRHIYVKKKKNLEKDHTLFTPPK